MILIFSEEHDFSTDEVIDWLRYFKKSFIRINEGPFLNLDEILLTDKNWTTIIKDGDLAIDLGQVACFWYRRGHFNIQRNKIKTADKKFKQQVDEQVAGELRKTEELIHLRLQSIPHIGSYFDNSLNKLNVLRKAIRVGLQIPNSLITSTRSKALAFCGANNGRVITKAIRDRFDVSWKNMNYYANTILLSKHNIGGMKEKFIPTLFQAYIEKIYELRVFFLDDQCYCSVIFSQNDPKTKIDFRNYNHEKPNRVCPYLLPARISKSITKLMNLLGLRTGSIDLIVTPKFDYVFLEVNPVGQFKQVSYPCNFFIEKQIATKLSCNR